MTPIAQHTRFQNVAVRTPRLQRPGRRAFSLSIGVASMLVLVDAIFHPGPLTGLWTVRTIQDLSALMLYPVVIIGLAAIAYGLRSRRRPRTSGVVADPRSSAAETWAAPTPLRLARPRIQMVETPDFSSRAA